MKSHTSSLVTSRRTFLRSAAAGSLLFPGIVEQLLAASADPKPFKVAGMFELPAGDNPCWAYPAIADGKLYLRWDDNLYVYDIKE